MRRLVVTVPLVAACLLAGCAPVEEGEDAATGGAGSSPSPEAGGECTPEALQTLEAGTLTVATSEPAYEPWVVGDDPASGEGYEAAVAYAIAEQLGYAEDDVTWVRADFNAAVQPGPKDFDLDLNQFSITPEREQAVDFSSSYYDVAQAIIATGSSPAAGAASLADLEGVRIGGQVGTTSLQAVTDLIAPTTPPAVYTSNDDAKLALQNGQVDALAVDLPTAFYITAAELDDGVIVGQLPPTGGEGESFGALMEDGSPLTGCVTQAVDALREDGTLADLEERWLADVAEAPVLQ